MDFFVRNFKFFRNNLGFTQEQLAKALSIELVTVAFYETGKNKPSMHILQKACEIFGISLDYLYLYSDCLYPRNLKLLRLAKTLDNEAFSEARSSIESVIKSLLGKTPNIETNIKFDIIDFDITQSFYKNLKNIRKFKKLTQPEVAKILGISRDLLAQYEQKSFPPIERLAKISIAFDVSMHVLITGEKLLFDFDDKFFGKTIFSADQLLTLEEHKMLIHLMEAIINNKT